MRDIAVKSKEEDKELQQSTKKEKEDHRVGAHHITSLSYGKGGNRSYKEKLVGESPGAFEQAFNFESNMETEIESDDEFTDFSSSEVAMKLFGERKGKMCAPWANAFIVKVFNKNVGYHFLHSKLLGMWKPIGKMDCMDFGHDFFLIKFSVKKNHSKVLRRGTWFVGGHYLSIYYWEPNSRSSTANVSSVAVWIQLPELSIEYYEPLVLSDIVKAIGLVLRIDTHTVIESRGRFAKLCVQICFNKPLVRNIKVGGLDQPVQYEGITALCFLCGRVGHKAESCPYKAKVPKKVGMPEEEAFGPWILVARKKK